MNDDHQSWSNTKEPWATEGSRLFALKRYAEALTAYERAIQLDPIPVYNYQGKVHVLFKLRRYKEAIQVGKQAFTYVKQSTRYQR